VSSLDYSAWTATLVAVGIASAVPLASTVALAQRPSLIAVWVPRLVFLAAGALFGAALFHLIPEALSSNGAPEVGLLVFAGIAAFALFERGFHVHGLRDPLMRGAGVRASEARALVPLTIASDALHNIIDGVLIASAFLARPSLGVITGVAIALHELPRELGTFAICVRGGLTPRQAILVNVGTGLLAIAGAIVALLVGGQAGNVGTVLMPFAAGNFLYLAAAILWSERDGFRPPRAMRAMRAAGFVGVGVLVTALLARH
jgi:zinc and cadmium transporter